MNPTEFVKNTGPELFGDYFFFRFGIIFLFPVLSGFLAICSTLELEADISTVARAVHVTWYFATSVHLGLVLG